MCKNLLGPICRHQSSCFFSWACILKKKLNTNFSFLTKVCQFSVVQSTINGTTTCAPYHCFHTVTYSVPVVPIWKLLQYSYRQGCGDTHCHIVGSYPQNHLYCTILHKCMHTMHTSNLAGTSSQLCSTILYHVQSLQCTKIKYTSLYFEIKLS